MELQELGNTLNERERRLSQQSYMMDMVEEEDEFEMDENESLLSRKKQNLLKKKTEILNGFDIDMIPSKIQKPLEDRNKPDKLATSLAKCFAVINLAMVAIGIVAVIISVIRSQ